MLCENCQHSDATVHLGGWYTVAVGSGDDQNRKVLEHHLCEACARDLKRDNPLISPELKVDSLARSVKIRVISVSASCVEVGVISENSEFGQDRWTLLASRIPSEYKIEGLEFGMLLTGAQLKWLKGEE